MLVHLGHDLGDFSNGNFRLESNRLCFDNLKWIQCQNFKIRIILVWVFRELKPTETMELRFTYLM